MVRIISYKQRNSEDGRAFFVLELSGGIEMVKSQATNQYYATAKKAFISSTFDEQTCMALVGTEMAGSIQKVTTLPYEYTIKDTGEVIMLEHKYAYNPEEVKQPAANKLEADVATFSKNGQHKYEEEFAM